LALRTVSLSGIARLFFHLAGARFGAKELAVSPHGCSFIPDFTLAVVAGGSCHGDFSSPMVKRVIRPRPKDANLSSIGPITFSIATRGLLVKFGHAELTQAGWTGLPGRS